MQYNHLGNTDLQVSAISFGCMSLGEDEQHNIRLLHRAFDEGINFFDTADLYQKGRNEEFVGKAFQDRRDKVIIATKVGNQWKPDDSGWLWNPSKPYIKMAVHDSLRRLRTDYIDLYQLHGGTIKDPIDETIEAFEELKLEGHIRYYGISSIRPNVIREYLKRSHIASVMMQYNLLDRRPEEHHLDLIHENDLSVIVRGGLAKGLLAGKPAKPYLDHTEEEVARVQQMLRDLSPPGRTPAQTALQYCLAHPAVATVACGISTVQQLLENSGTLNASPLTGAELQQLKSNLPENVYEQHR